MKTTSELKFSDKTGDVGEDIFIGFEATYMLRGFFDGFFIGEVVYLMRKFMIAYLKKAI